MKNKRGKKGKKLTARQRSFTKHLAQGKSLSDAARAAGYTKHLAGQAGYQALKQIQGKMPEVIERLGFTDQSLIENYLHPLMIAEETKFFKDGAKQINVVAHGPRLQALDMMFKLKGSYAPRDSSEAAQYGIKVVILDMPRPPRVIDIPKEDDEED